VEDPLVLERGLPLHYKWEFMSPLLTKIYSRKREGKEFLSVASQ
jgi:hypothetical protein